MNIVLDGGKSSTEEMVRSTERGRGLLPDGFLQLWQTVEAARREPAGKGAQ